MDTLLLFSGFPVKTEQTKLHGFLEKHFRDEKIKKLWMDPRQEARAVALFENVLDAERIQYEMQRGFLLLEDHQIFFEKTYPTNSLWVHTYGVVTNAAADKLKMLFRSKKTNCGEINNVVYLENGMFEIIFENGWDSVLLICQKDWIVEKKKLDVCPFFDCFKEPADMQNRRLNKNQQSLSQKSRKPETTRRDSKENTYTKEFMLKIELVAFLLQHLKFESAVQHLKVLAKFLKSDDSLVITLKGRREKVKQLLKFLAFLQNILLKSYSPNEMQFLCEELVRNRLEHYFHYSGSYISFADLENLKVVIRNKADEEQPLQSFAESLLKTLNVFKLSNEDFKSSEKWETFRNSFNGKYNFCKVYICDNTVCLMYLVQNSSDISSLISVIAMGIGNENIHKNDDVKDSVTKMFPSHLIWLLKVLHFKKAVSKYYNVMIQLKENLIRIMTSHKDAKEIQQIFTSIQDEFREEEKQFLKDEAVKKSLKLIFKQDQCHIEFNIREKTDVFVENNKGEKLPFHEFMLKHLVRIDCSEYLEGTSKTCDEWASFIKSNVKSEPLNHPFHVIMEHSKVMLLTVPGKEDRITSVIDQVKKCIHSEELEIKKRSSKNVKTHSTCCKEIDEKEIPSASKLKNEILITTVLSVDEPKFQYCKTYLMEHLNQIKKSCKCSRVDVATGGIHIEGISQSVEAASYEINKLIENIQLLSKTVNFPGLSTFRKSSSGSSLIEKVSKNFKCIIEFPNGNSKNLSSLEAVEKETVRTDYSFLLLQTARFEGFNIHLVQGKMGDMKLNMAVEFNPSTQDTELDIRPGEPSHLLQIILPPWRSCQGKTIKEHFANLRLSLRKTVNLVLQQADQAKCSTVGFSTEKLHAAKFKFPLDVIADVIISELVSLFEQNAKNNLLSVYVVEPEINAVFKAFDYFIDKHNGKIEEPDQASWDDVCHQELSRYPNYDQYQTVVRVSEFNFSNANEKTLFCYPIDGTLEVETCPACEEHLSIKKILSESVKKITDELPDGLLIGEVRQVYSFPGKKDVVIFCSSQWGFKCDQMIQASLKNCLSASVGFDAVHIVLPGVHGTSKFPKKYLAQAVFKQLDSLLQADTMLRRCKIALIINSEYKECFEHELQRRYPKKEEPKFSLMYWLTSFWASEHRDKNKATTWKTTARNTVVNFLSLSSDGNYKASSELEKELNHLLNKTTETVELNSEQTLELEKIMKKTKEIFVTLVLNKHIEDVRQVSSKTFATLKIQGLSQEVVKNFKKQITQDLKLETNLNMYSQSGICNTSYQKSEVASSQEVKNSKNANLPADKNPNSSRCYCAFTSNSNPQNEPSSKHSYNTAPYRKVLIYGWKFERYTYLYGTPEFHDFEPSDSEFIEKEYVQGKVKVIEIESALLKEINFMTMTATFNRKETHLIRYEILENADSQVPTTWKPLLRKTDTRCEVYSDELEYKTITSKLEDNFVGSAYKIRITKIERVQNKELFNRFETKKIQLRNNHTVIAWHRVSNEACDLLCKHSFHPIFSAMPDGRHLGDGVLFCFDAKKCISNRELKEKTCVKLYLAYSSLALGRTDYGQPGLRSPPFKTADGLEFDSVLTSEECMIFSDSQAYPNYLVTLWCSKNVRPTSRPKSVNDTMIW